MSKMPQQRIQVSWKRRFTRHLRTGYSSDDDRLRQYQARRLRVKLDLRVSASELLQLSHSPSASLGHTIKLLQLTIRCFQFGLAHRVQLILPRAEHVLAYDSASHRVREYGGMLAPFSVVFRLVLEEVEKQAVEADRDHQQREPVESID